MRIVDLNRYRLLGGSFRSVMAVLCVALVVGGCSGKRSGGYYQDDGPPRDRYTTSQSRTGLPADATPKVEPLSRTGNRSYKVMGRRYYPLKSAKGFSESGMASWYGKKFHGRQTSSGEVYDMYAMTAAHKTLPLPSYVRVTNLDNQRQVVVRVNDRGPFLHKRIIDLSYSAAKKLGMLGSGTANVRVDIIDLEQAPAANVVAPRLESEPNSNRQFNSTERLSKEWLQVGAFSARQNAQRLQQKMHQQGFSSVSISNHDKWHKVMLGPLQSHEVPVVKTRLQRFGYVVKRVRK